MLKVYITSPRPTVEEFVASKIYFVCPDHFCLSNIKFLYDFKSNGIEFAKDWLSGQVLS